MATLDAGPKAFFTGDHQECDEAWAAFEEAAGGAAARQRWSAFEVLMRRHLAMEEEVLFPAVEDASGMHGAGPTEVMRHEHQQFRALLAEMALRAEASDFQGVLDQGDTLLLLVQQHNLKEENVLYPMAEDLLGDRWPSLAGQLKAYLTS